MKGGNGIGVGIASVLVIVVVLALTTFGILSLAMARADMRMSAKTVSNAEDWYAGELQMQKQIADVDAQLAAGSDVFSNGELNLVQAAGEGREIRATLRQNGSGYEITSYGLVNTSEWNPDSGFNVWGGN